MYTTNNPPVTKPFVLLYEDVFHNMTKEGVAFMITTEEFKEQLLHAEKLQQAAIWMELDIKYRNVLRNENTSGVDMESNAARIKKRKQQREKEEQDDESCPCILPSTIVAWLRKEKIVIPSN
jgi:hypothetical protein